jgi:two-component sensor histidine kinase
MQTETLTHVKGHESASDILHQYDWSETPLGPRERWPQSLRTAVDIMMASGHAMCLAWGPARTFLYNEAYVPMLGARHPAAFGAKFEDVWSDIWAQIAPLVDATFAGETATFRNMPLTMARNGYPEETWWTFSYSPVRDEQGDVAGLLNVTLETTEQNRIEQQRDEAIVNLSKNEAKWRKLFETLEEGFILGEVVRDEMGQIVDWRYDEVNDAWYDLVGIERGCAVGRTIRELFPGIEDEWVLEFARVVDTGEAIRFTRQVGNLGRWYDGVCQPAGDDRFTVIFLEVTDRIRAEQRRDALIELGQALSDTTDTSSMIRRAEAIIGKTLGVGRVGYGTVEPDGETFTIPEDWTADAFPSLAGTYQFNDYGSHAADLREGRSVVIPDVRLDARTVSKAETLGKIAVRAMVNLPVVENGRTVAVFFVHAGEPRQWAPEEIAFVSDVASRLRTTIERRKAEEELRERESFLSSVLAASTDCIKVLNLDGELTFMSEGGMKVMEIGDFNAVCGCPWPDFMKGSGVGLAHEGMEATRAGRSFHFEAAADTYLGTPRFWSVSLSPIFGENGQVERILSVSRDHTVLEEAREQQRLLNGELSHRLKNVLTIVQSIANQTLRDAVTLEEASAAFSSRLASLGRATDVLTATSWEASDLVWVLEAGLAVVDGRRNRVFLDGPAIRLNSQSALALTLAVHELGTNAMKYGALSNDTGTVTLKWVVTGSRDDPDFSLLWQERGGPTVSVPARKGFGSRMIERSLRSYFRGETSLSYPPEGVEFRIKAPLDGAGELVNA